MPTPPSYHRWLVVAMTMANQAVLIGIAIYCFTLYSVPWQERFEISSRQLMLATFMFQIVLGVISPVVGHRLDKISLRTPIIAGLVIYCAGLAVLSTAAAYWHIIAVYALLIPVGVVLAGSFTAQLLITRWFTSDRGLAIGVSATGTSIGGMAFPPLIATAMSSYSVSTIMLFLSISCALVLIPLSLYVLRYEPPQATTPESAADDSTPAAAITSKDIITAPTFWILMLMMLPAISGFSIIQYNLGTYLKDIGYPVVFAGQLISLASLMMIVGKLMYGKLADIVDHRFLLAFVSGTMILTLALLLGSPSKLTLYTIAVLWGTAGGGLLPLTAVIVASRFKTEIFGKVMGLVTLFMILTSLGPLYAGWIRDLFGNYDYAFITLIVLIAPGIIIVRWLPSRMDRS